jgi:hypothetical protein
MDDRFEVMQRVGIPEDHPAERAAIQLAVGTTQVLPEPPIDSLDLRRLRGEDQARFVVRVDDAHP